MIGTENIMSAKVKVAVRVRPMNKRGELFADHAHLHYNSNSV